MMKPKRTLLAFTAALLLASPAPDRLLADPLLTYPLRIKEHTVRAEIANTEESRRRGLMFRRSLPENHGMIFIYPAKGRQGMWMKNTPVPLSVAFIDERGHIVNIADMEPFSERPHYSAGEVKYALEVNQGWFARRGIRAGDRVEGLDRLPPAK
jgi:uncharacterized protein